MKTALGEWEAQRLYSAECVEGVFSEVHTAHSPGPLPVSVPGWDRLPPGIIWPSRASS